jgi:inosine-uridine nucleoside N-ribohydrolase
MSFQDLYHKLRGVGTAQAAFMTNIEHKPMKKCLDDKWPKYVPCDEIAVAVALQDEVAKESTCVYATVELAGRHTWGQMVVDWNGVLNKAPNVTIVTKLDADRYETLLFHGMGVVH